jgi:CheY-like chemotaxis protein
MAQVGFQVQMVKDGAEAIARFQSWKPHLIWMELPLPVISGMDAARRIRELAGGSDVKIIALTASAVTLQGEELQAAELDGCLRKPYRRAEVFACMARHLGVRYVYRQCQECPEAAEELRSDALAGLPEELRNELGTAVISLDVGRITEVIHRIAGFDAALGALLLRYAETFTYTAILRAVAAGKNSFTKESV